MIRWTIELPVGVAREVTKVAARSGITPEEMIRAWVTDCVAPIEDLGDEPLVRLD